MTTSAAASQTPPADQPDGYDPIAVERKWQERWRARGTNDTDLTGERPFYSLMMFPYPSAEGLHVGNLFAFTGADIYGRFMRMQGRSVLEPFGFDAFGIHSENYALKIGAHPAEMTPKNVANFRRQIMRAGLMIDWRVEVNTSDPSYYKWTQWVFLQLLRRGLAYRKRAAVNWCPNDKTVLANEQVEGGRCERCGAEVEQRFLEQWFFRITDYAQRLLDNLDTLDWSESTKAAQRNWIGRSEGAQIAFEAEGVDDGAEIVVFTTRPDTVFGATYLVLAPEHPAVARLTTPDQAAEVAAYRERTAKQDLVTRKVGEKEKTGVFTGSYAVNPANDERIPIWIADYVLMEYGTGAIMAVPGHDERDFEFARKFGLPIVRVVMDRERIVSAGRQAQFVENALTGKPSGAMLRQVEASLPPLERAYTDNVEGVLVNSGDFDGLGVPEGKRAIVAMLEAKDAGKAVVNYRLHDWCISRQRYWGPPIPVIYCEECGLQAVPEQDLPVVLPLIDDFKPDDSGVSPLARHEAWYHVPCPECGKTARRETDVSDTFLDSAWYFLRYPTQGHPDRERVPFDRELTEKWLPVDSYIGGNEHAVLHLLYSRFITMVLKDAGLVDFEEPFARFRAHGLIIREGAKMSKSKGNVVNPDEYMEEWGADAFRTYLMFLGPYEEGGDFRDQGISGPRGFLNRLWISTHEAAEGRGAAAPDADVVRKLHQTIKKVGEDTARLSYNTAIAAMMEYMNAVRKGDRAPHRDEVRPLVQLVAPFAPHIAEELWERLGGAGSVFDAGWPTFDPALVAEDTVEIVAQVNGKTRGRIRVRRDAAQPEVYAASLADANVSKFVTGEPKKVVYVPGRLINIVV